MESQPTSREQRVDEAVGAEDLQVVDAFADADVFHRDAHLLTDRDGDSASKWASL